MPAILIFCFLKNAELDALEADMDFESESVPSYLQPDQESELNLPAAPTGHAAAPPHQQQVVKTVRLILDICILGFWCCFSMLIIVIIWFSLACHVH